MRKTVFILGAGASVDAGGPLMNTFLDRARDLLAEGKVADRKNDFERVFKALVTLRGVFYKSVLDLDNIESVFGAFEMAATIGKLGNHSEEEIAAIVKSIRELIVRTLDELVKCSYNANPAEKKLLPSTSYGQFVEMIEEANRRSAGGLPCSLLTFNYDLALDYALMCAHVPYTYCLTASTDKSAVRLLKLHGSLNWSECLTCKKTRAAELSEARILAYAEHIERSMFSLPAAQVFADVRCAECGTPLRNDPVIVPPTWNKIEGHKELACVWRQAAIELKEAENIVCMGYSLPESDLFFRYLFALGTVGDAHLRRFWVFDPNPEVEKRYRKLIGKGIKGKFKFESKTGKFGDAIQKRGELWEALMQ